MKDIIVLFYDWCFDFQFKPIENNEELICEQLDIKVIKILDDFNLYHNGVKINIKNNREVVKNIIRKLEIIFLDYASNL
jgi:hypothetical protein